MYTSNKIIVKKLSIKILPMTYINISNTSAIYIFETVLNCNIL